MKKNFLDNLQEVLLTIETVKKQVSEYNKAQKALPKKEQKFLNVTEQVNKTIPQFYRNTLNRLPRTEDNKIDMVAVKAERVLIENKESKHSRAMRDFICYVVDYDVDLSF